MGAVICQRNTKNGVTRAWRSPPWTLVLFGPRVFVIQQLTAALTMYHLRDSTSVRHCEHGLSDRSIIGLAHVFSSPHQDLFPIEIPTMHCVRVLALGCQI